MTTPSRRRQAKLKPLTREVPRDSRSRFPRPLSSRSLFRTRNLKARATSSWPSCSRTRKTRAKHRKFRPRSSAWTTLIPPSKRLVTTKVRTFSRPKSQMQVNELCAWTTSSGRLRPTLTSGWTSSFLLRSRTRSRHFRNSPTWFDLRTSCKSL